MTKLAPPKPYVYKRAEDLGIGVEDAGQRVLVTVTSEGKGAAGDSEPEAGLRAPHAVHPRSQGPGVIL